MRFEEVSGRRAEVALELLREGEAITYRGLGLHLVDSVLECRLFVQLTHAEALDAAKAEREFWLGKAILDELLAVTLEQAVDIFQIGFQHPCELSTVCRQLLGLVVNCAPDRVEIGFERPLENIAAFGQLLDLAGDQPIDAGAALRQLGDVVFQCL